MRTRFLIAFVANLHLAVMAIGIDPRPGARPVAVLVVGAGRAEPINPPETPRSEPFLSVAAFCPTTEFDPAFFDMGSDDHGRNLEYLWSHVRLCKTRQTAKQFNQRSAQRRKSLIRLILAN